MFLVKLRFYHYFIWCLSSWQVICVHSRTIYDFRCMWTKVTFLSVQQYLFHTPVNNAFMQESVNGSSVKQSCFRCKRDTWNTYSEHIVQPPKYVIIIGNRFNYIDNQSNKNKCFVHLDPNTMLGSYTFSIQDTTDHHGLSVHCGHCTTSVNCWGKTFYCIDDKITVCDIINTRGPSTSYMILHEFRVEWGARPGPDVSLGTAVH